VRGSIIKRGNGYSVVLDLGHGSDGRRIRKWHSGYKTKKEAERARVELLARLDQGAYLEPSKLTVAAFSAITGYLVSGLKSDRARGPNITQRLRFTLRRPLGERSTAPHARSSGHHLCRPAGAGPVGPDGPARPCHHPPGPGRRGPLGHGPP
jgi:Arm DNA-binding domain